MEILPAILVTALLLIVGTGIIMLVLVYQKKQLQYFKEKDQLRQKFEKEMLEIMLEIKEQTFKEVSEELHDNVAQVLTLAKLNLATINLAESDIAVEKIDDSKELLTDAIQNLRNLATTLTTLSLGEIDLEKAIEIELKKVEKTGIIKTMLKVHGVSASINSKKAFILFRIVQESIQNILKHANATLINISICYEFGALILNISDNGSGFNLSSIKRGNGLQNLKNRCKVIGAVCNVESIKDSGVTVSVHLPLT